jgi:hypothetical protein
VHARCGKGAVGTTWDISFGGNIGGAVELTHGSEAEPILAYADLLTWLKYMYITACAHSNTFQPEEKPQD